MAKPNLSRIYKEAARIMGPAFLVSVAYMDPGNWATAIEAGSRFGYQLVWVVVLSNLIAILLQTLAARLGLVTGKHLAQVCREAYPPLICHLLWVLCEVSIVALDLTMVLGTAIGLNLLLGWPMLPCILLTGLDALLLLLLVPRQGVRTSEQLTVGLLVMVVGCFLVDLLLSKPPVTAVIGGLVPRMQRESVYAAVCLLGANVMPHNFYLHSALVAGQARGAASRSLRQLCLYNFIDIAAALGLALVVNVAVLLVAAATFHQAGIVVETLQDAHDLMEKILSSTAAPAAFGLALLCAGQLSTFTGTIAGQVVLRGFLNVRISTWLRRVATRSAAVLPAALLQYLWGDKATYRYLLVAQVVLALQLPFTLVPLIKATSSAKLMGQHKNSRLTAAAAWAASGLVFVANLGLFVAELWPGAAFVPQVIPGAPDSPLHQYLDNIAGLAWARPGQFLLVLGLLMAAAALLALQLWVIITPLAENIISDNTPLLLRQTTKGSDDHVSDHMLDRSDQHKGWNLGHGSSAAAAAAAAAGAAGSGGLYHGKHDKNLYISKKDLAVGGFDTTAAAAVTAAGAIRLSEAYESSSSRRVVVGWNVPGVREWLMGIQPAEIETGLAAPGPKDMHDVTAGWSAEVELPVQHRLTAAEHSQQQHQQHPRLAYGIDEQQQQQAEQHLLLPAAAEAQPPTEQLHQQHWQQQLQITDIDVPPAGEAGHTTATSQPMVLSQQLQQQQQQQNHVQQQHIPMQPQQQQQQHCEPVVDDWDDIDVESYSVTVAAAPSSPTAASETSTSFSMLGADREMWLDTWPEEPSPKKRRQPLQPLPPATSQPHHRSRSPLLLSRADSDASSISTAFTTAAALGAGSSAASVHSVARSAASAVTAAGSSGISKSGRRGLAAALDGFWSVYYDTHGNWLPGNGTAATAADAKVAGQQHQLQQLGGVCCQCGSSVRSSSGGWCSTCAQQLLQHMQSCLSEMLNIPGAHDLVMPAQLMKAADPALQQQQQETAGAGATSSSSSSPAGMARSAVSRLSPAASPAAAAASRDAAAPVLLSEACGRLPHSIQQQLNLLLPAAAAGCLPSVFNSSSSASSSKGSGDAAGLQTAAAAAVLWSWGILCILQMLILTQVEVRPELWGKYAAVLNRLQGLLPGLLQQQQRQAPGGHPSQGRGLAAPLLTSAVAAAGASNDFSLASPVQLTRSECDQLRSLLLDLLSQVEAAVTARKAPSGGGGVGAAFAKGKEICLSVVKRYRRKLLQGMEDSSSSNLQQQHWSGRGARRQQRALFGVLAAGLLVMPMMLAVPLSGCGCVLGGACDEHVAVLSSSALAR